MSGRRILFILPTSKPSTGGERVNVHLLNLARDIYPETELFELSLLENKTPKWLRNLFEIRYLGRVLRILIFFVVCPKQYKSICFTDYYSVKDLFIYLFLLRVFFRSINLNYFHQMSSDIDELKTYKKTKKIKYRISFLVFNLILVNSIFNKKELMLLGVPEKKIKVFYPLLINSPMRKIEENKKNEGLLHLLFVGGNFKRKGLVYAIQAISRLNKKDLRFDIIGDINKERKYSDYLMKMVEDEGLNNQIRFWGRVDGKALDLFWNRADIFLFPALFEGFGIVLAEAMSYHLPIISTNVSAIPELVQNGENGILVPPEDPDSLAMAIEMLASNSDLRKQMGENGYRKIKKFYDLYNIDTEFKNILEGVDG